MVLRQRKKVEGIERVVQELDAFPKVPEDYVEQTASGASVAVVTALLVAVLLWFEAQYFLNPGYSMKFVPDGDYESKLTINVDITVAMPCDLIGADIMDSTSQNTFGFGRLKEEKTWFELDHIQRKHFDAVKTFNEYLREEYHNVAELMWKSGQNKFYGELPQRRKDPDDPPDSCRIYGSLSLNKVAGNFHVTAGKSLPLMRGHAHLAAMMGERDYNFSHRIDKFSFGNPQGGIVQPLEGDEKIANKNLMNYQYFISVVPTDVQTSAGFTYNTFQYSVKDQVRPIDHETGSHGVPGIYFKYDMSALKVIVNQDREPLVQFLVRLCAAVGGLVACSKMVCLLLKSLVEMYCCKVEKDRTKREPPVKTADLLLPQEGAAAVPQSSNGQQT